MSTPLIHNVAKAAERAMVSEAVILQWIREGMRAAPVGRVGKRGPRDYRIFDSWLVEFIERRAGEARQYIPNPIAGKARSPQPGAAPKLVLPKLREKA